MGPIIKAIYVVTEDGETVIESGAGITITGHDPQGDGDRFYWRVSRDGKGEERTYFQGNPGVWQVATEPEVTEEDETDIPW